MTNPLDTNRGHAKLVAKSMAAGGSQPTSVLGGIWHWINGVASGLGHFITGRIDLYAKATTLVVDGIIDAIEELDKSVLRAIFWLQILIWHKVTYWLARQRAWLIGYVNAWVTYLYRLIYVTTNKVMAICLAAVSKERRQRIRAIAHAEAQAKREIKALHHLIEREAASGYKIDQQHRLSLIVRILDFAVVRQPELRGIVRVISTGVLDLLSVDDPIARLTIGFLIKHVIDRLGIDKALGSLLHDLIAPLLGQPIPRDLHDVIADLSARMIADETQWAQFFQDGGSQVEQAGIDWRNITGPVGSAAIVAFTVAAVAAPDVWAKDLADTVGRAVNDVAVNAVKLFGG